MSFLVDTHCHLDFERFDADRDAVVDRAHQAGVGRIIVPSLDLANAPQVLALAERYEAIYAAVGIHPNSASTWQDEWLEELRRLAQHPKVVAIGEIGLDYYWDRTPKEMQHRALEAQLSLAAELNLPVILHNRESSHDLVDLLARSPLAGRSSPGVWHSFSASWPVAQTALEMGYYLGFTGPITFKKADELRAVAAQAPGNRILVETDAPFLTPHPHRGRRNEPAYVAYVASRLAQVRQESEGEIISQTTANAASLFTRLAGDE